MTLTYDRTATAQDELAKVNSLVDLSNVREKLADRERSTSEHLSYPDADIVPCKIVDEIWHQHILDTAAYRDDCDALFGRFLDHFPYFGMRGEDDAQALLDAYADTLERYEAAFGEPPEDTWISRDASSKCKRTACKPQKCR